MKKISFVIPCYNSSTTIGDVVLEINKIMLNNIDYSYEIILIDDNSNDNVFDIIRVMAKNDVNIVALSLSKNFGQHSALMAGYSYAKGDIIVSLDDDGQIPVDEVFSLIKEIEAGHDVVYAYYDLKMHNKFRNLGSLVNDIMAEILIGKPKELKVSSFFAMKKYVVLELLKYNKPYPYLLGLTLRTTTSICCVNVRHRERKSGKSGYTLRKLISMWLNGFTAFSIKPLRIATVLGVCVAFIGFIFGIYTIINKIMNPQILSGYSSIMSALLFIGGMIMLMLGLLGEYVGRIYICINNSPQYVIRDRVNLDEE